VEGRPGKTQPGLRIVGISERCSLADIRGRNANKSILARVDGKWVNMRVPYPLGFYTNCMTAVAHPAGVPRSWAMNNGKASAFPLPVEDFSYWCTPVA
jgi:hypothetical protein